MTTGSSELDSLIDGIEEGLVYLFYGDEIPLESLSNRFLINCILPKKVKHGFESTAICLNNTDYYSRKLTLNPESLARTAKAAGIEPKIVSKNLLLKTVYNPKHQVESAVEIAKLVENSPDTKLVVLNNLTKYFQEASLERKLQAASLLKEVMATIWRTCVRNKVTLIATGKASPSNKGIIPRAIGGTYFRHSADVIVYIRDISASNIPTFKTTLVKHQYMKTPKSATVHGTRCGRRLVLLN
jgi:hypothetical protein